VKFFQAARDVGEGLVDQNCVSKHHPDSSDRIFMIELREILMQVRHRVPYDRE
jgi:hypothetical protein